MRKRIYTYDWVTMLYSRNRLTHIENNLVVAKGEGEARGIDREFGVSR